MIYSYYPGCTLKDRAKEMDKYARASAAALGIELREIPQWQCCGAVYPQASDEIASRLSAVRALMNTEEGKLVTMCSACHHVIKRTNYDWNRDADFRMKATNYMKPEVPYDGSTQVLHFLEVIRDEIGFEDYVYGEGVCLIEWANLIDEILPEKRTEITIEKDLEQGFDYRRITIVEREV